MYSSAELGANVPVGAGVIDCPMHKSARTHAPSTKVVRDIVEDDELCNREDGDRGHGDSRTSRGRVISGFYRKTDCCIILRKPGCASAGSADKMDPSLISQFVEAVLRVQQYFSTLSAGFPDPEESWGLGCDICRSTDGTDGSYPYAGDGQCARDHSIFRFMRVSTANTTR